MYTSWSVLKIDFDGAGQPLIDVLKVFSGPDAEQAAYVYKAHLENPDDSNVHLSMTRVKETVIYVVRQVGVKPDDED